MSGVVFSADRRLLAVTGWHSGVWLFDARTAKQLCVLACNHVCHAPAFSPDGKLLAAADGKTETVRVWDTASGKLIVEAFKKTWPRWLVVQSVFTADGRRVLSCNREQTLLWEARTGKILWCWNHPQTFKWVGGAGVNDWRETISPDGLWDAVMPERDNPCKLKLWRLPPPPKQKRP